MGLVELSASLAGKVLLANGSPTLRQFYSRYLARIGMFYLQNVYACFAVMIVVFLKCSRGGKGLSKCVPFGIRESLVGQSIASSFFLGAIITIFYSIFLI